MTTNVEQNKNGSPSSYIRHNQRNIARAREEPNEVGREGNKKIGISLEASLFNRPKSHRHWCQVLSLRNKFYILSF